MKTDLYKHVTDQIVSSLEQGVRPWTRPWSAEHAAGRITRPLRANGLAYQGINVLVLCGEAIAKGYSAPIWMTFRQALELSAHVRKGERGSTVVYASTVTRTGTDGKTGEETEQAIPFLKSYTVFNVEQIEGLPAHFHAMAEPRLAGRCRCRPWPSVTASPGATSAGLWVSPFFGPELVDASLQGQQPVELTATRLTELDLPLDWTEQRKLLAS
jgi:antirestriction protein ArdC